MKNHPVTRVKIIRQNILFWIALLAVIILAFFDIRAAAIEDWKFWGRLF